MVQIDKYKVCQTRWDLGRKKKKKSLSTSYDNDEDTAGRVISIIDKGNFYLHLSIMMKMQPPTTYYDIAHRPIIIKHIKGNN